jgi:hypothetical protein
MGHLRLTHWTGKDRVERHGLEVLAFKLIPHFRGLTTKVTK